MVARITVSPTGWCGYCRRAKTLLRQRGLPFEEIRIDEVPGFRERLFERTGGRTVPRIAVGGKPV